MTKTISLAVLIVLAGALAACAQLPESSPPRAAAEGGVPVINVNTLAYRPSMQPLLRVVADSGRGRAYAEVEIDYDAGGTVTAVRLVRFSGHGGLDKAILDWSRQIRLKPGAAGTGRLPFEFTRD